MHNVEARNPGLCPGYLELSNTPESRKTLSLPKPPEQKAALLLSLTVLDGKAAPGRGKVRNPSGFRQHRSAPFRTAPLERPVPRP